ncbi:AFR712Cp [Eremothecium gossypii ATCC 10895]|uniref:AFR712Cp n=1 Tax=Eremothecium gossypii (strain ATCC 10895 / CBS 109.51 / FGSC 9923 / NRRL Y-1056) TaxID=284811 RepID=Q751W3_EREGS|nr:AFR712Cp [Eremothecium gossypii ATCC 10895]AAS54084.1 AFR712Cp [Eremothecium gossypii ATCC 10895]AEY98399.1 FAFR712Cp [Eremothecium gossypii FDAG1]
MADMGRIAKTTGKSSRGTNSARQPETRFITEEAGTMNRIRSMPIRMRSGVDVYQRALQAYKNARAKQKTSGPSWMMRVPYYQQLQRRTFDAPEEVVAARRKLVDDYMVQLGRRFQALAVRIGAERAAREAEVQRAWEAEHGKVPEEIQTLKQHLRAACSEAARTRLSEQVKQRTAYNRAVTAATVGQGPVVHALPGSPAWAALHDVFYKLQLRNTILFSIDIEAFESNTSVVTEVGISVYDPRENEDTLVPHFRTYHLCPEESLGLINKRFVPNHKCEFLHGETMVMPLSECVEFINGLIEYYLYPPTGVDDKYSRAIVGHGVSGDLQWLRSLLIDLPTIAGPGNSHPRDHVSVLDTAHLYQYFYGQKGSSLGKSLRLHGVPHSYLHNAGNDAYYTLQLLMKMGDVQQRIRHQWDDLYAVFNTLKQWEEYDNSTPSTQHAESVNNSTRATGKDYKPKSKSGRNRRHLDTHINGMRYHHNLDSFLASTAVVDCEIGR